MQSELSSIEGEIDRLVSRAVQHRSHLQGPILDIPGMTGRYVRHLLNNLVANYCNQHHSFLEVGTHRGATLTSALFRNTNVVAYAIDNWSKFGNQKSELLQTLACFQDELSSVTLIETDFFEPESLGSVQVQPSVVFYDGDHSETSQYNALPHLLTNIPSLSVDSLLIYVVDDYNEREVHEPTRDAINDLEKISALSRLCSHEFITTHVCRTPHDPSYWWNGLGVHCLLIDGRQ